MKKNLTPEELIKQVTSISYEEHPVKCVRKALEPLKGEIDIKQQEEIQEEINDCSKELSMLITNYSLDLTEQVLKNDAENITIQAYKLNDLLSTMIGLSFDLYYQSSKEPLMNIIRAYCQHFNQRFIENINLSNEIGKEIYSLLNKDTDELLNEYEKKHPYDSKQAIKSRLKEASEKYIEMGIELARVINEQARPADVVAAVGKMQTGLNKLVISILVASKGSKETTEELIEMSCKAFREDMYLEYNTLKNRIKR